MSMLVSRCEWIWQKQHTDIYRYTTSSIVKSLLSSADPTPAHGEVPRTLHWAWGGYPNGTARSVAFILVIQRLDMTFHAFQYMLHADSVSIIPRSYTRSIFLSYIPSRYMPLRKVIERTKDGRIKKWSTEQARFGNSRGASSFLC